MIPRTRPGGLIILWRQQRLFELWRLWDSDVREINPDSCVIPNTGGGATSTLDMKTIGELAPILFADRQGRSGVMAPWANGKNGKEYRSTMGRKPIGGIFSVGVEEAYRWKDSVQSPAEIRLWAVDGIANGLRPWFTKFAGTIRDPRWLKVVEDLYRWHHRVEKYLRNEAPLARVGLVYSQQTAWFHRRIKRQERASRTTSWAGTRRSSRPAFRSRWCTTVCSTPAHVDAFKTLILPSIAALSDEQCQQLRAFVEPGRQHRGDVRDIALRRVGCQAQRLRSCRPVRSVLPGPRAGPGAELVSAARGRSSHAPAPSASCRPRRRAPRHRRDLPPRRRGQSRSSTTRR